MSLEEELVSARRTVVTDGYEMSIGELMSLYKEGELEISPPFQRLYRWSSTQKTRFIESLLLGIPIPPIFVFTKPNSKWELVDGLQRLSTVFEFTGLLKSTENTSDTPLRLQGTKLLPSLNNLAWQAANDTTDAGLSPSQQLDIKRRRVRVEILKKESDDATKYELFQRLNTGGSPLSEQEVRDCVMVMLDETFFAWIKKLSDINAFKKTIDVSDRDRNEQRPTELCLRLLAYLTVPYDQNLGVHEYLDAATIQMAKDNSLARDALESRFASTFTILEAALGAKTFRKWTGKSFSGAFSISAYEAIAYGVAKNVERLEKLATKKRNAHVVECVKEIWSDPIFLKNSGAGVRGTTRLSNLLPIAPKYFK